MLTELRVGDLGIIERAELVLGPGMTVLSGETGAGKTLVVEALGLLVGGRADPGLVRAGADEAVVEGRFVLDDEEHVVRRVVPREGRSRAYLDDRAATATALAEFGARALDLHGQHAHQSLLGVAAQRDALDRFGAIDREPYEAAKADLAEINRALDALGGDERSRRRELDLVRFQLAELDEAAIEDAEEDERLDAEEDLLADAVAHREAAGRALEALGDDRGRAALGEALAALDRRTPFAATAERLHGLVAELDDLVDELRTAADGVDPDPERLSAVRARRQLLADLRRKYGESVADVLAFADELRFRLRELESHDDRAAALDGDRVAADKALSEAAADLGRARRTAAPGLADAATARLRRLAMEHAELRVTVGADPGDDVVVELAANPGSPAGPLAKVASGGELARTMLALRLVTSEAPDTLVFDEVDAGVGGRAASFVGEALAEVAERHQVLVVTHLPQVASLADHQVVVAKQASDGVTVAAAEPVTGDARVGEIARMLSGDAASAASREHARELLGPRA